MFYILNYASYLPISYFLCTTLGFVTDNERALEELFGDEESTRKGHACLNEMATRISTVFASLREFPFVRYRAAKSLDMNTMTTFRDLIPTKLAAGVWNCLARYKANLPNFPQTETCELLIVDRSIDQIAPVIHEWTYDAMCHDLLNMEGNKYVHEAPGKVAGVPEKKEVLLEDHDPIWLELRHAHIADASERLHEKMTSFVSKNKAAQVHHGSSHAATPNSGVAGFYSHLGGSHYLQSSFPPDLLPVEDPTGFRPHGLHQPLPMTPNLFPTMPSLVRGLPTFSDDTLYRRRFIGPPTISYCYCSTTYSWSKALFGAFEAEKESCGTLLLNQESAEDHQWHGHYETSPVEGVGVGSFKRGLLIGSELRTILTRKPSNGLKGLRIRWSSSIAGKINRIIKDMGLKELGQLEQDLVFGDAGTKDDVTRENKLRLLMIYAACYPEKFESDKITKLMELARLPPEDMNAVNNMRLLEGSSDTKKNSIGAFSLKFDVHKKQHAARKDRTGEEVMWQLSRFYPMIEELVEKLSKGELPKNDYPCMNDPSPTFHGSSGAASNPTNPTSAPHSMRQRRATWARPRSSDDGYSSDSILRHASSDFKKLGQRIFVFIVGGATRSELRICHKLTAKLKREIVLGSSSLDDPPQFITMMVDGGWVTTATAVVMGKGMSSGLSFALSLFALSLFNRTDSLKQRDENGEK
ncbi:hypothetical protein RHSIM_Rhsim11G0001200 [Rhododendron simsii]|uniref:SNARE-interacting protein KEULE n=1 Tax=Rhododendron simsii TaxID=118357 RepID=A0A834G5W2_RHOSS|nr:hypothetical protein RHSIM_Rhsim11G0001200 [Rhododendron simsii]